MTDKAQMLGEAAHIKGAAKNSPRFDPEQTEEERHSAENGLWLCERCAELIDKNGGADFPVGTLLLWKQAAERAALERVTRTADAVRDNFMSSIIFMNIPRLRHYSALTAQFLWIPDDFDEGITGDGYIAPQLYQIQEALRQLRFPAAPWSEAVGTVEDPTGLLISFEGQFRTKNGPRGRADRERRDLSDLKKAPHVYQKSGGLRLVVPYDPRFVTTTTATVELTQGQVRIGGFGVVKFRHGSDIVASPLIFGLRSTPEVRAFWNAVSARD